MSGWLARAAAAFGKGGAAAPQAFTLPCDCGEHVTGWRTETHQKLNCPSCDRPLLVLPADPYPRVRRSAEPATARNAPTVVRPGEPEEKDERSKTSRRRPDSRRGGKSVRRSGRDAATKDGAAKAPASREAETKPAPQALVVEDRIEMSLARQQTRSRLRLRLVAAATVALLAVTGWSLWTRSQREWARTVIPTATQHGMEALHSGDFSRAAAELTVAVTALDTLRRNDSAAATIRQAHREAVAAKGLCSRGLDELANEMIAGRGTLEERQARFASEHGAGWFLFDVGVVHYMADGKSACELDVPLVFADDRDRPLLLNVDCDFPQLRRLASESDSQHAVRVVFAAQLLDWSIPGILYRPVRVRINPATAFLWTDYESYCALGYRPSSPEMEQETRSLLSRQRQREQAP